MVSDENSCDEAYALFKKASDRMAQGGFNLRKWLTNDAQLNDKISKANNAKRDCGDENSYESFAKTSLAERENNLWPKVLGLAWNCKTNTLDVAIVGQSAAMMDLIQS